MKLLACLLAVVLAVPANAEHVVTPEQVASRLMSTASDRTRDVDTLVSWAATHGVDARSAVARLTDAELADLAARAEALTTDPVAGNSPALIILATVGVLLILLIILGAIACADDEC